MVQQCRRTCWRRTFSRRSRSAAWRARGNRPLRGVPRLRRCRPDHRTDAHGQRRPYMADAAHNSSNRRNDRQRATLVGFTAILMWTFLAALTVASDACRRFSSPPSRLRSAAASAWRASSPGPPRSPRLRQPPESRRSGRRCSATMRSISSRCGWRRRQAALNYLWPLLIVLPRPCCRMSGSGFITWSGPFSGSPEPSS